MILQFPDEHAETRTAKEMAWFISDFTCFFDVSIYSTAVYIHRTEYYICSIHKVFYLLFSMYAPPAVVAECAAK